MDDRGEVWLSEVARLASDRSSAPADLLGGYLELLVDAAASGRPPGREVFVVAYERGTQAAERGIPLARVIELFVVASELSWEGVTRDVGSASDLRATGQGILAVAAQAVAAVADGFETVQRQVVNREMSAKAEFVDDLLAGARDLGRLAERAQRFGVPLVGSQVVAVARSSLGFSKHDRVVRAVETAMVARFGAANVLVAVRESLMVCIMAGSLRGAAGEYSHQVLTALGPDAGWQVGVSRPHPGPSGVMRAYEEARDTLNLADSLGFDAPVLHAADFLVFPVLLRDRSAMVDLVQSVLSPLVHARTGARPLLDTLDALFASQGNSAGAARRLGVSVRTVTYRLDRVHRLTGYSATEQTQRFTLEAAVLGARILGWPERPLPT